MSRVLFNCSSQNINQTKALNLQWAPEKDIRDQHIAAELWAQADTKRKGTDAESIWSKVEAFKAYPCAYRKLSGPLCRARVPRMKYGKKQKTPRVFGRPLVTVLRVRWIGNSLEAIRFFSCLTWKRKSTETRQRQKQLKPMLFENSDGARARSKDLKALDKEISAST